MPNQKFNPWNKNTCKPRFPFYKNLDPSKIFNYTVPRALIKIKISYAPHRRSSSHGGRYQSLVKRERLLKLHPQKVNHPRPREQKQKKVCAEYCIVCILIQNPASQLGFLSNVKSRWKSSLDNVRVKKCSEYCNMVWYFPVIKSFMCVGSAFLQWIWVQPHKLGLIFTGSAHYFYYLALAVSYVIFRAVGI